MPPFKQPQKLANLNQVNKVQEQKSLNTAYQVVYTRDIRKKKKQMHDGILVVENQRIKLFDMESKQLHSCGDQIYENVIQYYFGQFFVEILNQIPYEDYQSGKAFVVQSEPIQQIIVKPKQKFKSKKQNENEPCHVILTGFELELFLYKQLRSHQIDGVRFMLECVTGRKGNQIQGCILADSMGLGKTLQAITLMWILIQSNFLQKIVITCPVSLIGNWEKEIKKWLGPLRLQPLSAIGSKEEVNKQVNYFLHSPYNLLLTSYETFRNICNKIDKTIELIICDEGHRLKNTNIKTVQTMNQLACKRRIVLSGTPIQNNMNEFYACCDFVNPGIFVSYKTFKQVFQDPIEKSLEKGANQDSIELGKLRSQELSAITSQFILRRKPEILSKFLPNKYEYLVFCNLTEQQEILYKKCLNSQLNSVMIQLNLLRKITTHPKLLEDDESEFSKSLTVSDYASTKLSCIKVIVEQCREKSEKIVINSYYRQTLDIIEQNLIQWNISFLRLDGKVQQKQRLTLVEEFNRNSEIIVFLLNGKSGGTGLNLVGANKMICVEVDWNPANDSQVMGRIWRDGQKKIVHIYRLISCGTYEEKIMQRQISKENLSSSVVDDTSLQNSFTNEELKDLLTFRSSNKCKIFNVSDQLAEENDYPQEMEKFTVILKIQKTEQSVPNVFDDQNAFLELDDKENKENLLIQLSKEQEQNEDQIQNEKIIKQDENESQHEQLKDITDQLQNCQIDDDKQNSAFQFPLANVNISDLFFLD